MDIPESAFPSALFSGMTMLDWFASQADIPWNAVKEGLLINKSIEHPTVLQMAEYRAELKYIEAEAMMKRRVK